MRADIRKKTSKRDLTIIAEMRHWAIVAYVRKGRVFNADTLEMILDYAIQCAKEELKHEG